MVFYETNDPNSSLIEIVENEVKFNHRNITVYVEDVRWGDGALYLLSDR